MPDWRPYIRQRLAALQLAPTREAAIVEELAQHLADCYAELLAGGATEAEAYQRTLAELSGSEMLGRELRRVERRIAPEPVVLGSNRRTNMIADLWQDLRYGARMLLKTPGFTAVAALSLALGIGANTAIFTLINVAMLKSLPVSRPEELVGLYLNVGGTSKNPSTFSQALWEQIRERQDVFTGVFVYGSTGVDLSGGGEARPAAVGLVSGGFFSTLGVRPLIGRILTEADDQRGCSPVAVITHAFWQSEYGGGADVIGKLVALNNQPFQIVGVTEPAFFGVEYGYDAPIWAPQCAGTIIRPGAYSGGGWVIGRLKPGVTLAQSRARLAALAPGMLEATLPTNASAEAVAQYRKSTIDVAPFAKGIPGLSRDYGEALFVLLALVGVVLLIACVNVANLLLARATVRRHEIAVRLALGASRSRLIRQLLTESLLLAFLGAALGLLFAGWGSRFLAGFLARRNQVVPLDLTPDWRVLGFTLAVGALAGLLFGLAPAWRAACVDLQAALKPQGRTVDSGRARFGLGKALVVAQIALSLVMIVGAGLLAGSWRRLATLDPGFRSAGVLLAGVNTRPARIPAERLSATYSRILERLRALPGVATASAAGLTPFGNTNAAITIHVEGYTPTSANDARARFNQVSDGYFATIGTRILAGRDFNRGDVATAPPVAIVNEELARKFFGGAQAHGQRLRQRWGRDLSPPVEIVGIAANIKESSEPGASQPTVYYPLSQVAQPWPAISFALRAEGAPAALIPSVRAALVETGARFSLDFRTLQQQLDESVRLSRMLGLLSGFFGVLALLLAALGLYGMVSYSVARRRSEIGVRLALGATRARIIRMALGEVGRLVVAGSALGVLLALAATRLVASFLYGVAPNDPVTLALSAFTLAAVTLGAALIPAWRGAGLNPLVALRDE